MTHTSGTKMTDILGELTHTRVKILTDKRWKMTHILTHIRKYRNDLRMTKTPTLTACSELWQEPRHHVTACTEPY